MEPRTYLALLSLSAAYFTLGVGSLSVVALVQPMAPDLHTSVAATANLLTAFALTFALSAPLAQLLLGHLPRRTLLLGGLLVMSASATLGAVFDDYWAVLATRVAMGAGAAVVGPMCSAIGAGLVRTDQQGRALALVFSGMTLATVLGVPVCAWLGGVLGWRAVFLIVAAVALAAAMAIFVLVADRARGTRPNLVALLQVVARRRSGLSVATTLLQMASQFATYALIAPYLTDRTGATAAWVVAALFAFGVGGILGNLLAGRLADRIGADRTVGWSLGGVAASYALLIIAPASIWAALPLLVLWAVMGILFQAPQQKRLVQIDPGARSLLLASNASALYLGMSAGSLLAGVAHLAWGAGAMPVVSLLLVGAAALTFAQSR
jgi:DHA1 family inner membrane transport protein